MLVVGVATGNGPGGAAPGTVGVAVAGAHGTLTLVANGYYSYVHTAGGGSDVFTYTIRDTDGSLAHATLTISLGNSAPSNIVIPAPGLAETMVFEAGLPVRTIAGNAEPAGSHVGESGFPTTTQTGTIRFTSPGTKAARWSRSEWKIASRTSHGSPHLCCWKHRENAERGLGYGRKDNKILPMSRKIFSR